MGDKLRYLLLLSIGVVGLAQQTSTIYQQITINNQPCVGNTCTGSILPLPYASNTVRAIGQANHAMSMTLTNAPSHTCSGGSVDWGMEYSFDNVMFTRFGDQTTSLSANSDGQYTIVVNAYGAYPYVRLKVRNFDTTNCVLTAAYSGVIAGQATISITGGPVTVTNTPNVRPLPVTGFTNDYDTGLTVVPNSLTVVTASATLIMGIWCNNITNSAVNLTITNTAGTALVGGATTFSFPAASNGFLLSNSRGLQLTGIKWQAGTASALNCQIVGMQ